jgi:hypothetical protein
VPLPGPPAARGHLRIAPPPAERPRPEHRALLLLRAGLAALALLAATALAFAAAAVALVPLLARRAPLAGRLRPIRTREARVLEFRPRRDQQALPR